MLRPVFHHAGVEGTSSTGAPRRGGIDRPAERVYGDICGLESIPTAGGFLLVLPVDLPPFLGLRRPVIGVAALAKRAA